MARKITLHFVEIDRTVEDNGGFGAPTVQRDYTVQARQGRHGQGQGQTAWTLGRIFGSTRNGKGAWNALPVGGEAWTRWHPTRAAALVALQARENCLRPETFVPST
jgi:hypothetical protein